jgi:hypothetical protein
MAESLHHSQSEASTIAEALVTKFFCRFGIPREVHSDQGLNFESLLPSGKFTAPRSEQNAYHASAPPIGVCVVERYIKTREEHLRNVVASHQRDWDERLPLFLLAYRATNHDTTGFTPARLVFGRELRLPCDLVFGTLPDKERPTTDHEADLLDLLHDIHNYARQLLKLASDRMKTRCDELANSGYREGNEYASCRCIGIQKREGFGKAFSARLAKDCFKEMQTQIEAVKQVQRPNLLSTDNKLYFHSF